MLINILWQFFDPRILKMLFLWTAGGIYFMMTGSTMTVWLKEHGLSLTNIGFVSLLHLPYGLRFLWSPIIDYVKIPYFSGRLGIQKSWLIFAQILAFTSFIILSQLNPAEQPILFAITSFFIAISAATADMILQAYQIFVLPPRQWGIEESVGIFGYRIGMLIGGASALILSEYISFPGVYLIFGIFLSSSIIITLTLPEFKTSNIDFGQNRLFFKQAVILPIKDFINRNRWWAVLLFMMFFRLQDYLIMNMTSLFYIDLGFSKTDIASCQKLYGMWVMILGGILGGIVLNLVGYFKSLWIGGILHGLSGICYLLQAYAGSSLVTLYITTGIEDLTKGIALTVFFSYQLTCIRKEYAVTQLAALICISNLSQAALGSISGILVDFLGWKYFFAFSTIIGFAGVLLVLLLPKTRN